MQKSLASKLAALAATAIVIASGGAFAQADHHHGARGGGDFALGIAALKGQLNLNTSQQQMWDNAVAATRAARQTGRTEMQRVHASMAAELAKPAPDLGAVAAVADDVQARNTALRRQVRDNWLAVYGTLSADQKLIVRDALAKRMARMESFHQRHGAHSAG